MLEAHPSLLTPLTGGTVAAMHDVMTGRHRAAMQLAGGTHHAFFDRGEGFCVFNDLAVASGVAIRDYGAAAWPILVVDLDVHQGNGTAAIFENDPRVVTFSMHGERNYPWKSKMRSTCALLSVVSPRSVGLPRYTRSVLSVPAIDSRSPRCRHGSPPFP